MPIVTSAHIVGHAQKNGWSYVRETHMDDANTAHEVEYLAAPGTDYVSVRTARVARINEQLAQAEAIALITSGT